MTRRRSARTLRLTIAGVGALLAAAHAGAQTLFFVAPDRAEAGLNDPVLLAAADAANKPVEWPADRIGWMFLRCGGDQQNWEPGRPPADPGKPGPSIKLEVLDAAMLGVDLMPRDETLDAKALAAWARANLSPKTLPEGLDKLDGGGQVVVRRIESAKAFLRARGEGEQRRGDRPVRAATATDKSGQPVEIRPLIDVTSATVPTDVPVRMYAFGDGAKKCLLRVVHVATGEEQRLIADDKAIAFMHLERPGAYRLEFHALVPSVPQPGEDSKATWTLSTATATFTVPAPAKAEPAPATPAIKGEEKPK